MRRNQESLVSIGDANLEENDYDKKVVRLTNSCATFGNTSIAKIVDNSIDSNINSLNSEINEEELHDFSTSLLLKFSHVASLSLDEITNLRKSHSNEFETLKSLFYKEYVSLSSEGRNMQ